MSGFLDAIKIVIDKFLMSDFIFNYKAKSLKNGVEFGNEETQKFCKIELDCLTKERIAKTKNRKMADYFIGLSEMLNHSVSSQHFKKFYTYLVINDGKVELNQDNLKRLNSTNNSFKIINGILFVILAITCLSLIFKEQFFEMYIYLVIMLFFMVCVGSFIIPKKELNEFKETIGKYNDQIKNE